MNCFLVGCSAVLLFSTTAFGQAPGPMPVAAQLKFLVSRGANSDACRSPGCINKTKPDQPPAKP